MQGCPSFCPTLSIIMLLWFTTLVSLCLFTLALVGNAQTAATSSACLQASYFARAAMFPSSALCPDGLGQQPFSSSAVVVTATTATPGTVLLPFALSPVCLAFQGTHLPNGVTLSASAAELVGILTGNRTTLKDATTALNSVFPLSKFHIPNNQTAIGQVLRRWIGLSSTALPDATLQSLNPQLQVWNDEDSILSAIASDGNSAGIVTLAGAISANLSCAYLRVVDSSKREVWTHPRSINSKNLRVDFTALRAAAFPASVAYPMVSLSAIATPFVQNTTTNATIVPAAVTQALSYVVTGPGNAVLARFGLFSFTDLDKTTALRAVDTSQKIMGGGTSFQDGLATLSLMAYSAGVTSLPLTYDGVGSDAGYAGFASKKYVSGICEAPPTLVIRQQMPTLQLLPIGFFYLNFVYSFPEPFATVDLVLDPCTVYKIFAQNITRWDHPDIAASNPGLELPSKNITLNVRAGLTGHTEMLTGGMVFLEKHCGFPRLTGLAYQGVWPFPNMSNMVLTTGATEGMFQSVAQRPWSLGYAGSAGNFAKYDIRKVLLHNGDGLSQAEQVRRAIEGATYDAATLEAFANLSSFPFIGTSYFVFERDATSARCDKFWETIDFIKWVIKSSDAQRQISDAGFTPAQPFPDELCDIACNGIIRDLCPKVVVQAQDRTPAIIGGSIGGSVGLLLIGAWIAIAFFLKKKKSRETSNAPTDPKLPFSIVFTDVQASTRLWGTYPAEMSEAIQQHHKIIRKCIARHNGYEVKTIGDAFMVAFRDPCDAVKFALSVQESLYEDMKCPDIDQFYIENFPGDSGSPWKGLRVRIGAHVGTGQVSFDEVTLGWDYYGNVVNTAARIEAAGHGGQTLISAELLKALPAELIEEFTVLDLPPVNLRGLDEPLQLHQIATSQFSNRKFAALRTGEATNIPLMTEVAEEESTTEAALRDVHFFKVLLSPLPVAENKKFLHLLFLAWNVKVPERRRSTRESMYLAKSERTSNGRGLDAKSNGGSARPADGKSITEDAGDDAMTGSSAPRTDPEYYALIQLIKRAGRVFDQASPSAGDGGESKLGSSTTKEPTLGMSRTDSVRSIPFEHTDRSGEDGPSSRQQHMHSSTATSKVSPVNLEEEKVVVEIHSPSFVVERSDHREPGP